MWFSRGAICGEKNQRGGFSCFRDICGPVDFEAWCLITAATVTFTE